MIYFDLKTSARNILRNKVQSVISILGLGIGFGCIILLLALIIHETSFNKFIPDHKNVFRVILGNNSVSPFPLAEELKTDFPEVTDYFRFYQALDVQLRSQKNELVRDRTMGFADPSIFRILGIKMISGTAATALNEIAVSQSAAKKYFGSTSPLGAVLQIKLSDKFEDMVVTGVYRDFPSTSTLYPGIIAPIKLAETVFARFQNALGTYGNTLPTRMGWNDTEFMTFVVLDKNSDKAALALKMEKYKEHFMSDRIKDLKYTLQPVSDIYLKSEDYSRHPYLRLGNEDELKYFQAISLLILIISVLNYILLTRASIAERFKELGTRKAFGASCNTLRRQIILESNMVALFSLLPASFVIDSGMSFINDVLNKTLNNEIFQNPLTWLLLVFVVVFTGTFSGLLIGYNYSKIPSLLLLSGKLSRSKRTSRWTYSFLVFHFSIYVVLVACVIVLSKQINYSLTGYKGINPENVIITDLGTPELKKNFQALSDEIEKIPGVVGTAGGSFIPPFGNFLPINLQNPEGEKVRFDGLIMGEGLTELLGIEIVDGSSFGVFNANRIEVLMNESSAARYNLKAGETYLSFYIRGIVKDFNAHSMHTLIEPLVILQQNPLRMALLAIKTDGTNDKIIIERLRSLYSDVAPDEIFEVTYLTEQLTRFYSREQNQATIIGAFSILATVLSMMGLFGIALISISKRTKEIGIRKVNGAKITEVLYLLNIDFIRWVVISIIVAVPVSVYIMTKWLERFAYRTTLDWWIFAIASVSAVLIALITISWQSLRAATRNPVEALRYE